MLAAVESSGVIVMPSLSLGFAGAVRGQAIRASWIVALHVSARKDPFIFQDARQINASARQRSRAVGNNPRVMREDPLYTLSTATLQVSDDATVLHTGAYVLVDEG